MDGFELNKIAGAVLLAGIITMVVGFLGNALVPHEHEAAKVIVASGGGAPAQPAAGKAEAAPVDIAPYILKADVEKGKAEARKCTACHNLQAGAGAKIGPDLWDVVGRKIASVEGFSYSSALKAVGGEWTYQKLSEWLTNPQAFAKGTKMSFAGIKKPDDRGDVIAYLRTLAESPKPLPKPEEAKPAAPAAPAQGAPGAAGTPKAETPAAPGTPATNAKPATPGENRPAAPTGGEQAPAPAPAQAAPATPGTAAPATK